MKQRISVGTILIYVALTIAAILWIFPVLWMYGTSFKPEKDILLSTALIPRPTTLAHYLKVLTEASLPRWFFNSVVTSGLTTTLVIMVDAMAGYAFARVKFPGRDLLFIIVVATLMVPQQVLLVPLYVHIVRLGWINTYTAMAFPRVGLALGVFLMRQFFQGLPRELEEAAYLDGAGRWTLFTRIAVPLAIPAFSALTIFTFLGSWNDFLWPMVSATRENMYTLTVGLANFSGSQQQEYGAWMAAACLASTPVLLVFLLLQRQFVRGITLTGIKG
ncbi:MAG TPA: carbohydrate ABC transporter permease [Symbiobacteriaceae bacterium]|nr:carbohydrate ABC transporter permease [Symbiobacteriaceae bacterium]